MGSVFKIFEMGLEFWVLSDSETNCWYKGQNYLVCDNTSVWLSHTVAKLFDADNLQDKHIGYIVLADAKEGSADPQFLYYFTENGAAEYERAPLKQAKDYAFYLASKKYNLAANGGVTEAKKEDVSKEEESPKESKKNKGRLEKMSGFFKNKYDVLSSSRSTVKCTLNPNNPNMSRRPGDR